MCIEVHEMTRDRKFYQWLTARNTEKVNKWTQIYSRHWFYSGLFPTVSCKRLVANDLWSQSSPNNALHIYIGMAATYCTLV